MNLQIRTVHQKVFGKLFCFSACLFGILSTFSTSTADFSACFIPYLINLLVNAIYDINRIILKSIAYCRYSEEVKQFAATINFYSPRAYRHLRTIFSLPHPGSLQKWASSVNCETGFFKDVLEQLRDKCKVDFSTEDCCLIFDGMSIRKQTIYNQKRGCYEGFVGKKNNLYTSSVRKYGIAIQKVCMIIHYTKLIRL